MRLMRFSVRATYIPGKDMLVADVLSRSPVITGEDSLYEEIQAHVNDMQDWPRSEQRCERCESKSRHGVRYPWLASVQRGCSVGRQRLLPHQR